MLFKQSIMLEMLKMSSGMKIAGLWSRTCFPAASALDTNTVLSKLLENTDNDRGK